MDFGDVIFFVVFVLIVIANIAKQLKKAGRKTSGDTATGNGRPEKKSGWKNVLEQMLEEARKQMENQAEPESAGTPTKPRSGWEDFIPKSDSPERKPERKPEIMTETPEPFIPDEVVLEESRFRPDCMNCNEPMKEITDFGIPNQSGLIYCDICGERHKYKIIDGELSLKRADAIRKSVITPERRFLKIKDRPAMPMSESISGMRALDAAAGGTKIPRALSLEGLRSAVVWSEILGAPLGLRDLER